MRTVEELCLSGHNKVVSFRKEHLKLHSVFYQWIRKLASTENVELDKKPCCHPSKNTKHDTIFNSVESNQAVSFVLVLLRFEID